MQYNQPLVTIKVFSKTECILAGHGWTMEYGFADSPFGLCFVATTPEGICSFQFVDNGVEDILKAYKMEWTRADHVQNDSMAASIVNKVVSGRETEDIPPLMLHIKGTPFQQEVWNALLSIPLGTIVSYSELAKLIYRDRAVRAVASAVARNPIGLIIPCHRVVLGSGCIGQYHWGSERKQQIIMWESDRLNESETDKYSTSVHNVG